LAFFSDEFCFPQSLKKRIEKKKKRKSHANERKKTRALSLSLRKLAFVFYHSRAREVEEMFSSGATTRLKKRKLGQRDLWDVIVNNDDICFKHILPRLNQTDVKFLYGVNRETRALVRRSSRRRELRKSFEVKEMSSISTLEFAWENRSFWPDWMGGERNFCARVAETNKLELLKWAREEKKCEWGDGTIQAAAGQGNLEIVKYCVANLCPIDTDACAKAALHGQLECLKYLREEGKAPWNWATAARAATNGHLHILEYLLERKYDEYDAWACSYAVLNGHLDCLKFLHETAKAPWNFGAVAYAHDNNRQECLQYLLDNDCPLPRGWRYEHGTLYALESQYSS
jgi:hypothetical protein